MSAVKSDTQFEKLLSSLNNSQRKAVEQIEGPVLVVAGPGTGKTQIIAGRIGYILSTKDAQAQPQNILCLTYTDAGTVAMRKRLLQFIGPTAYRVHIHTFHSFCNEVIQQNLDYFGKRTLEPITDLENISLLQNMIDELPTTHLLKRLRGDIYFEVKRLNNLFRLMKEEDYSYEFIYEKVNSFLNELPMRDDYIYQRNGKDFKKGDLKKAKIEEQKRKMDLLLAAANLFKTYNEKMLTLNRYDYSDMILWVVKAFKEDENLLRNYQEKYQYFLVDEFQDTNGAQNEILNSLTSFWDNPNIFTVGDDDQCIYEFQGARLKNIQEFISRHKKELTEIVLTENYRSTQSVLNFAGNVIENNVKRLVNTDKNLNKQLSASNPVVQQSKVAPQVLEFPNIAQEEAFVVDEIERLQKENFPLSEVAVIYHRHKQAENIIHLLDKKNIPFQARKKINILDLPLIQNLLTILKFLEAESRKAHSGEEYLFELMHYRFFDLDVHDIASIAAYTAGKKTEKDWRTIISSREHLAQIKLRNADAIDKLEKNISHWIAELPNITLQMLFEKVLNESGLLAWILKQDDKLWQLQVILTFFDYLKNESFRKPRLRVTELIENIEQLEKNDLQIDLTKSTFREDGVNFVSAHSAKGLEFQHVYLIGCTSDKWESAKGNSNSFSLPDTITFEDEEDSVESKRRLFYVAMTRAKEFLSITYSRMKDGKDLVASRFVVESKIPVRQMEVSSETLEEMMILSMKKTEQPSIKILEKNIIDKRLENFSLSVSALNGYLNCPVSFYFDRILKVPSAKSDSMAFGSAIHEALRKLFEKMKLNNGVFPSKEDFVKEFIYQMNRNKDSFTDKQFELRKENGKQVLPAYYDKYISTFNKTVSIEFRINNVEMDGVPINGMIDKIEFDGNDANVVDYKTGSVSYALDKLKPWSISDNNGGDYWRQIIFYKILIETQRFHKWNVVSGEIDFVEKDDKTKDFVKKKISIETGDVSFVKQQIKTTYENILAQKFSVGCGKEDCHWCNFAKQNNLTI